MQGTVLLTVAIVLMIMNPAFVAQASPQSGDVVNSSGTAANLSSEMLGGFSDEEKSNARIDLELVIESPEEARTLASRIEELWRAERFPEALDQLRALEAGGVVVGTGVSWRQPVPASATRSADVRIGTLTGAQQVALDYSVPLGHLFALVNWGPGVGFSLNISTDGGDSWSESYFWSGPVEMVDLSVVEGFAYVGYVSGNAPSDARLQRHYHTDGSVDPFYFQTVFDAGPNPIQEIALASNPHDSDDRIYYAVLVNGSVELFWDESSDGNTFTSDPPGVGNASRGLDMAYNIHWDSTFFYLSYVGTDDAIWVHRWTAVLAPSWDGGTAVDAGVTLADRTSISAHTDGAIVGFQRIPDKGGEQEVCFWTTYDEGANWNETFYFPVSGLDFYDPLVSSRSGSGFGVTWGHEAGAIDDLFFFQKVGYAGGIWYPPWSVNEHDFAPWDGHNFAFDWLGTVYGVAYFDNDGAVYFMVASAEIFADGFESGNATAWSSSVP